ncbi:MAG: Glu/Leu/Phe/Val dehydrogenase dimerization domain-containing protein [Candidatus Hodarchaeota archaeon]
MNFDIRDYNLFDEFGPEKIIFLNNPTVDMNAVLIIDNTVYGPTGGGVRFAPDITVDEMIRLARAMTLKFSTYNIPVGGAKSGIWGDPLDLQKKDILLSSFADSIELFVKSDIYYPGPDMGTDDNDLIKIFKTLKLPNRAPKKIKLIKMGIPVEELFTGYGVVYCLTTIYDNIEKIIIKHIHKNHKPRVIMEGFGKVGTALAMSLNEIGYKLTGVSTINGAIFDEDGLNVEDLIKLKLTYGDQLVNQYESKNLVRVPKEKLFELSSEYPTEFIIPGARPDAINKENVGKIQALSIVPAANIPYEKGVTETLKDMNIIAFPDFVVNAGEVLALNFSFNRAVQNADEIFEYIKSKITEKTMEVIQGAAEERISPYNYAVENALKEIKKRLQKKKKSIEKLTKR